MTQKCLGSLYGSLIGDALGVPVEFRSRDDRVLDPVTGMRGYGTHGQPAGTWSDDGALLLCSVESLVEKGFDTQDMGERFVQWVKAGHWSAHGTIFDIGIATRKALRLIEEGCPAELAGGTGAYDNGNGSLMRILPVVLASLNEPPETMKSQVFRASAVTHGHERSQLACALNAIGSPAVAIGGTSDHVHLLFRLSRTMTVSAVVKNVKVESSKWMKENGAVSSFAWQAGYGAFSIGVSQVKPVIHYIQTQEKHHAQKSFQEEYRRFLELYGVSYDEVHVWD